MLLVLLLVAGLVLAVVFQLMLTNLSIALGLTVLDLSPARLGEARSSGAKPSETVATAAPEHESLSLPITYFAGFGVAAKLTGVLFAAALLATEFSEIADPRRGGIFGLMLWRVYWLLFAWLSTTKVAGIADSILVAVLGGDGDW